MFQNMCDKAYSDCWKTLWAKGGKQGENEEVNAIIKTRADSVLDQGDYSEGDETWLDSRCI